MAPCCGFGNHDYPHKKGSARAVEPKNLVSLRHVIPAEAGIQISNAKCQGSKSWISALAEMTVSQRILALP